MKKAIWLFAVSFFKIGLLTICFWLLFGVLTFVTFIILQGLSSSICTFRECTENYVQIFLLIELAEITGCALFVTWVLVRLEKRSEKQKRKQKPSFE